jgi:gluconolactonase
MHRTRDNLIAGITLVALSLLVLPPSFAQAPPGPPPPAPTMPPSLPPSHVVNLMTVTGSDALGAKWKVMEAKLVEVPAAPNAMAEYKTTHNITPRASEPNFDDSSWPAIGADTLGARRGGGHVSFLWYRTMLNIPAKIGEFDPAGAVAVLTVLVDDYAEIWINGQMPRRSGYPSPATIQGLNMPNRVVLTTSAKAGDKFEIAIFGINGPISVAPPNFIWFREARVEFYK